MTPSTTPPPTPPPTFHRIQVVVEVNRPRFYARCNCGWEGERWRTTILAKEDGQEHLASVNSS